MSTVFLLGHPVAHSLSPAIQNAAFATLRLPHRYETLDVPADALAPTLDRFRREDVLGANITIPYKEAAVRLVDELSDEARNIGAVNTVVRRGSRLVGENTDRYGFERSLKVLADGHTKDAGYLFVMATVLVLGAGGAARACVLSLLAHENSIRIASRTRERAEQLARALSRFAIAGRTIDVVEWPRAGTRVEADGVVNATPLGLDGEDPLEGVGLPACVVDIVPTAAETPLVRRAREAQDVVVIDGLPMLLYQAARSFELWTGAPAPLEAMRAALPRVVE